MIDRLLERGVEVARLHFRTHAREHAKNISMRGGPLLSTKKPIAILADLSGPKIRTGPLAGGGPVLLHRQRS